MLNWSKLVKQYKDLQPNRKKYNITWKPEFFVDDHHFEMVLIPTVAYTPWFHVQPGWGRIILVAWLNFGFTMGKLERKEDTDD